MVNPAGLTQAKTVPIRRTNAFADPGLGAAGSGMASPSTRPASRSANTSVSSVISASGSTCPRCALSAMDWPGRPAHSSSKTAPRCPPAAAERWAASKRCSPKPASKRWSVTRLNSCFVNPDGHRLPSTLWAQYGLAGVLEHEAFVRDVTAAAAVSGVVIEQFHPEYGANQFENSLTPQSPVAAADQLVLTRIIIGRVARRYGLRVSLSPAPFVGDVGCGAHQHFSLTSSAGPLFSDGAGTRGMTSKGENALAGVLRGLPEAQGVLCGSIVSGLRLHPGNWAGAYACWGTENREAALRFVVGGPGNPYGGNVEVKVVDPSANPYFATAAILGLALDGIKQKAVLPPETKVDPAALSDSDRSRAGIVRLSGSQAQTIAALDNSQRLRAILGDPAVDVVVAVRRFEHEQYSHLNREHLADKFRMAWSV